ncbi:acyltransferase [Isoptericola sp. NEAU-Y5]|uniref:Acyltransferase n=1 Tax=Isoptericola luteus TaxID=2879484 RepID=A0ABS7ZCG9_9MICO|nr:acyltransferase family protein [Isoptericola sp. NEAU-Y5]MCA5892727.1 acyltransferase [Isoptericola sp. NEAU-Y5]
MSTGIESPTAQTTSSTEAAEAVPTSRATRFRPDVEGLRAIAIGSVLLFHAGIVAVPGGFVGVDVFFVISGFLITGQLVREVEGTGKVSLVRFYARRARRLLPAAALVLVVTAGLVLSLGSIVDRKVFAGDIVAAAAYVENWRLAGRSVDYLAEGVSVSPVQHFWSLSVEEQFYIVWPILLLVVALLARRFHWPTRWVMAAGLAAIVVPSFVWSVVMSAASPANAFFVTTTRLWELGVGGLVAVGITLWPHIPRAVGLVLGWGGIAAIVAGALLLDESAIWPGHLALVPVLGTAAVIIAGTTDSSPGFLGHRLMVWLGGLSYSLYLWHWPLLIAATWVWGELGQKRGLLIVVLAVIPAWLSYKLVENPMRRIAQARWSPGVTLSVGLNLTALTVIAGLLLANSTPTSAPANASTQGKGAQELELQDGRATGVPDPVTVESFAPLPQDVVADRPDAYDTGCQVDQQTNEPHPCAYGDRTGSTHVMLLGDSKALQWIDALDPIAKDQGWVLDVATKSSCGFSPALQAKASGAPYKSCLAYNAALLDLVLEERPDAVIVSQGAGTALDSSGDLTRDEMVGGLVSVWRTLEDAGIDVVVIADNPRPHELPSGGHEAYKCVAQHLDQLPSCAFDTGTGLEQSGTFALEPAADLVPDVDLIDMNDLVCDDVCPPVIGEVLVYRQGSHLSRTYVRSTVPILSSRLVPVLHDAAAS